MENTSSIPRISQQLVRLRGRLSFTQKDLANRSGVSLQTIRKIEQGKSLSIATATLDDLACALHVETQAFFVKFSPEEFEAFSTVAMLVTNSDLHTALAKILSFEKVVE